MQTSGTGITLCDAEGRAGPDINGSHSACPKNPLGKASQYGRGEHTSGTCSADSSPRVRSQGHGGNGYSLRAGLPWPQPSELSFGHLLPLASFRFTPWDKSWPWAALLQQRGRKKEGRKKEARSNIPNVVFVCLHIWVPKIFEFMMTGTAPVFFGTMVGIQGVLNGCSLSKKLIESVSEQMPPISKKPWLWAQETDLHISWGAWDMGLIPLCLWFPICEMSLVTAPTSRDGRKASRPFAKHLAWHKISKKCLHQLAQIF